MSEQYLADRLHTREEDIRAWESGDSLPDLEKAMAAADVFGVTLESMTKHTPRMNPAALDENSPTDEEWRRGLAAYEEEQLALHERDGARYDSSLLWKRFSVCRHF